MGFKNWAYRPKDLLLSFQKSENRWIWITRTWHSRKIRYVQYTLSKHSYTLTTTCTYLVDWSPGAPVACLSDCSPGLLLRHRNMSQTLGKRQQIIIINIVHHCVFHTLYDLVSSALVCTTSSLSSSDTRTLPSWVTLQWDQMSTT